MTIGGYIIFGFLALCIASVSFMVWSYFDFETIGTIVTAVLTIILCIALFFGMRWYYQNTESGKRAFKSQESNFNAGIERRVEVYDIEGDLIKEYEGKFDVTYDDDRILFDDEEGKRHVIYYSTGTVVIDELDG